jgi:hypothetical protein
MSSTTTTPVGAGTTYPMPPRPSWADKPDLTEGSIGWDHNLTADGAAFTVGVSRRDWIRADAVEVGEVEVYVAVEPFGAPLTQAQAREFAALLIVAAEMAEQD